MFQVNTSGQELSDSLPCVMLPHFSIILTLQHILYGLSSWFGFLMTGRKTVLYTTYCCNALCLSLKCFPTIQFLLSYFFQDLVSISILFSLGLLNPKFKTSNYIALGPYHNIIDYSFSCLGECNRW